MENKRFYIKTNNFDECHKAILIFKQLGFVSGNFISARSSGWVYGDDDGEIKFLLEGINSYPAVHAEYKDYKVYDVEHFPQRYIDEYKASLVKKLLSQPVVTKKEYRNTIEILKECRTHIIRQESDYVMGKYFTNVIKKLETYLND